LVSLFVDPNQGTDIHYSVTYVVNNQNNTTEGLAVPVVVPNKYFPVSSDYTVTNSAYKTFNTHSESSVSFDLALAADSKNRLDGVNVYFTSPNSPTGSNIAKVRIGSFKVNGPHAIALMQVTGGKLRVMNAAGVIVDSVSLFGDHDCGNISFEAFRDARVNSATALYASPSSASLPEMSNFYVESGSQSNFGTVNRNPVWNVPTVARPSESGSILLSGGVINMVASSDNHAISWTSTNDSNGFPFTYDLKVFKDAASTPLRSEVNLVGNSYVLPIDLATVAKYTIELKKVFNGLSDQRDLSQLADTIVFHSVKVDTSNVAVSVQNPSNTSSVTLSWVAPAITGSSVTDAADTSATFDNTVFAHHIQYRTSPSGSFSRLGAGALIENPSPKLYTLPNAALGTLYEFVMYVEAQVVFKVNGECHTGVGHVNFTKSAPFSVTLSPSAQYRVSTIPSIILPHTTPVLVQGSANPTLLLNLNAKGLEHEGFVSVVVILTQDGTPAKPDGEQALLVFPDSNNNHPFSFANSIPANGGAVINDPRLAGGESAVSAPRNVSSSVLSTQNNNYTLTIGTAGSDGRYGLSTLKMPSTVDSGFVDNEPVNYMVILTTRRGTDIGVGEFTYKNLPSVQDVKIVTVNGEYRVEFNINPA
jgi:hypothetical protein